jgi:hypothetical protein
MAEKTPRTPLSDEEMSALIEKDPIAALCRLVEEAGLTMTLHGVPVTEQELKEHALESATERMADAICRGIEKKNG